MFTLTEGDGWFHTALSYDASTRLTIIMPLVEARKKGFLKPRKRKWCFHKP